MKCKHCQLSIPLASPAACTVTSTVDRPHCHPGVSSVAYCYWPLALRTGTDRPVIRYYSLTHVSRSSMYHGILVVLSEAI